MDSRKGQTLIEICSTVYRFHKRYSWMLSSLCDQIDAPKLSIQMDTYKDDKFNAYTNTIKNCFSSKLDLNINSFNKEQIQHRGTVRTWHIQNTKYDWLFFTDADNVFPKYFFKELNKFILDLSEDDKCKVISSPRLTMSCVEDGYKLIETESLNYIEDSYNKTLNSSELRFSGKGRISGAGYFQLIHIPTIRKLGITTYVDETCDRSLFISNRKSRTFSDIVFRKKLNGIKKFKPKDNMIHIKHYYREHSEYSEDRCD